MISILIPVYNEEALLEANILKAHEFMVKAELEHEIVVTSNGSTDRTNQIGGALMSRFPEWFRFFTIPHRSVGDAFVNNVKRAKSDHLITLDADLSADLAFILHATDLLRHCDMVVGFKSASHQRRSLFRIIPSYVYIFIAQFALGLTINDYSLGAKGFSKKTILPALEHIDRWTGFVLELSIVMHLGHRRVVQIGVDCEDRRKSRFNLLHEGFYRYRHIYRCWKLVKDPNSWIQRASIPAPNT